MSYLVGAFLGTIAFGLWVTRDRKPNSRYASIDYDSLRRLVRPLVSYRIITVVGEK